MDPVQRNAPRAEVPCCKPAYNPRLCHDPFGSRKMLKTTNSDSSKSKFSTGGRSSSSSKENSGAATPANKRNMHLALAHLESSRRQHEQDRDYVHSCQRVAQILYEKYKRTAKGEFYITAGDKALFSLVVQVHPRCSADRSTWKKCCHLLGFECDVYKRRCECPWRCHDCVYHVALRKM